MPKKSAPGGVKDGLSAEDLKQQLYQSMQSSGVIMKLKVSHLSNLNINCQWKDLNAMILDIHRSVG